VPDIDRDGGWYNDQPVALTVLQLNVVAFSSAEYFELKTVMTRVITAVVADVISCFVHLTKLLLYRHKT